MSVHFILTGGDLIPQYRRAIVSAKVHEASITLWYTGAEPDTSGLEVEARPIAIPEVIQLHPAHIWDMLAFKIGYEEGGLVLGLDTISIRPALDLLGEYDFVCSRDYSEEEAREITISPYTMTFIARQHAPVVREMYEESCRRATLESEMWGFTGPEVLREFVDVHPGVHGIPHPILCGWNSRYIWQFYMGQERPPEGTRIIHLFSQGEPELWRSDWQGFMDIHPDLGGRRTTNDALLACPEPSRWTRELERDVYLRPGSSDEQTWTDTFVHRYHVPPEQINPRTVLDLGANIGLTAAHYQALWSRARIVAVEMDAESAAVCSSNFFGEVINAAVGVEDGTASYAKGAWAAANSLLSPGETLTLVRSLPGLIDVLGGRVDFVKMDIEGSEWDLFAHPEGWNDRVGSLLVELHGSEPSDVLVERALIRLRELGFQAERHTVHPHAVWGKMPMNYEMDFWGDCANTFHEEQKQLAYAPRMGLHASWHAAHPPAIDLGGRSVIDIGGGPVSLLLKCVNRGRSVVADPAPWPEWVIRRYEQCGIEFWSMEGESNSITGYSFDEAWIYNVLQHTIDPERVIENARSIAQTIRLFEWIEIESYPGHPQRLERELLNTWLGSPGFVADIDDSGAVGRCYYGVFRS